MAASSSAAARKVMPETFTEEFTFGGARRTYTRQRLYGRDDVNLPTESIEKTSTIEDTDPYAEAAYTAQPETTEAVDQFRDDIHGDYFRRLVEENREATTQPPRRSLDVPHLALAQASAEETRARHAAILRAMEAATQQHSLFSLDAFASVPHAHIREFARETASVLAVLTPETFVHHESERTHRREDAWIRTLADVGASIASRSTRTLRGHLRVLAPAPPMDGGWYTRDRVESEHAHYDALANTTTLRVLAFHVPALSLAGAQTDDSGYFIYVVAHLVTGGGDNDANVLCLRTFYFSRTAPVDASSP